MTSNEKNQSSGLPAPITELTMEQDLRMRQTHDALCKPDTKKRDIITIFMALQEQNFILGNSLTNLVKKWPTTSTSATHQTAPTTKDQAITKEEEPKFGTLFGITI